MNLIITVSLRSLGDNCRSDSLVRVGGIDSLTERGPTVQDQLSERVGLPVCQWFLIGSCKDDLSTPAGALDSKSFRTVTSNYTGKWDALRKYLRLVSAVIEFCAAFSVNVHGTLFPRTINSVWGLDGHTDAGERPSGDPITNPIRVVRRD